MKLLIFPFLITFGLVTFSVLLAIAFLLSLVPGKGSRLKSLP